VNNQPIWITIFLAALNVVGFAQIPEYVPADGLVAWWGMDGNGEDSHTGTHDATNLTATPAADRFGNENAALSFSGSDEMRGPGGGDMDAGLSNAITFSCWLKANQFAQNQGTAVFRHSPPGVYYNWALHLSPLGDDSNSNHPYFLAGQSLFENNGANIPDFALQLGEWHHVVLRVVDGLVDTHVDGIEVFSNQTSSSFETTSNAEFVFGNTNNTAANDNFIGLMDDVAVWNRGISDAEILALYQVQSPILGCTDETACNYNPEATEDDGGCFYLTLPDTIAASPDTPLNLNLDFSNQCREMGSASFDGQSPSSGLGDNVTLPSSLLAGAQSWSMIYSFTLADDGRHTLLCKHSSGENTYSTLGIGYYVAGNGHPNNTNNRLSFHASNGQSNALSNAVFEAGHHVVGLSYLNGILSIWIDGALDSQHNGNFSLTGDQSYSSYTIGRLFYSYDSYRLRGDLHWAGFLNTGLDNAGMQNWMDCPKAEEYNQSVLYFGGQAADGVVPNYNSPGTMDGIAEGLDVIPSAADGIEVAWTGNGTDSWTGNMPATDSEWTIHILQDGDTLCSQTIWFDALIEGCTDESACNYSPEADVENGSCEFPGCQDSQACNYMTSDICDDACVYPLVGEDCEAGAIACAEGTVWDAESQTCVVAIPAYLNEPGEAAILNPCYFDSNGNGLVEVTDLMNVLSVYGMACGEIPEAAEFSCGDALNYQGYDYATVQIGEQCWFAENLRSSYYQNGDDIPGDLSAADWELTNQNQSGACSIYGETDGSCTHFSPCIDPCDELASLETFGKLYNWYAVIDERKLCPSGWHVALDNEWAALEEYVVGQGFDAPGTALRSSSCWVQGNNGTDDVGFDAVPGGYRNAVVEGHIHFPYAGHGAYFWTASIGENSSEAWCRFFDHFDPQIRRESLRTGQGFSIRCIQD